MPKTTEVKEHWSRHPAFLVALPVGLTSIIGNIAAIFAVIHYALVTNIPLFVGIWLLGAFLSFIAGFAMPLYAVVSLFSKETRKRGYWKFLLGTYAYLPKLVLETIGDVRSKPHAHTSEEETNDQTQDHDN